MEIAIQRHFDQTVASSLPNAIAGSDGITQSKMPPAIPGGSGSGTGIPANEVEVMTAQLRQEAPPPPPFAKARSCNRRQFAQSSVSTVIWEILDHDCLQPQCQKPARIRRPQFRALRRLCLQRLRAKGVAGSTCAKNAGKWSAIEYVHYHRNSYPLGRASAAFVALKSRGPATLDGAGSLRFAMKPQAG